MHEPWAGAQVTIITLVAQLPFYKKGAFFPIGLLYKGTQNLKIAQKLPLGVLVTLAEEPKACEVFADYRRAHFTLSWVGRAVYAKLFMKFT